MLTKTTHETLKRAALGTLPRTIDDQTQGVDMAAFKELYQGGLIEAIDASGDCGNSYLEPSITLRGREALQREAAQSCIASF